MKEFFDTVGPRLMISIVALCGVCILTAITHWVWVQATTPAPKTPYAYCYVYTYQHERPQLWGHTIGGSEMKIAEFEDPGAARAFGESLGCIMGGGK